MLYVDEKDLVIPGEVLAEGDFYSGRGTFQENGSICSKLMGLVSLRNKKISVTPLKSKYIPKRGDVVIGKIQEVRFSMWDVDINSPYSGILSGSEVFGRDKRELKSVYDVGDTLFFRIIDVDEVKKAKLGLKGRGMGKFYGGIIVSISPTKVPRLIGKKGSMINMIKDKTHCKIVVGQNGLVWVKGEEHMQQLTKEIINQIEEQAHTSGLTNRIRDKLCLIIDGKLPEPEPEVEAENDVKFFDNSPKHEILDDNDEDVLAKPTLQNFKDDLDEDDGFIGDSVIEEVSDVEDFSKDTLSNSNSIDEISITEEDNQDFDVKEDTPIENLEDVLEEDNEITGIESDLISEVRAKVEADSNKANNNGLKFKTFGKSKFNDKVDKHSKLHFGTISQADGRSSSSILNPETKGKKSSKWRKLD